MLLKPSEVQFVELEEEDLQEETTEQEDVGENGVINGRPVLIGGTEAPIFLDFDIDFLPSPVTEDEEEDEFVFAQQAIVIGGESANSGLYGENYGSDDSEYDIDSDLGLDDSLYNLDGDFSLDNQDDFYLEPEFEEETEVEKAIKLNNKSGNWDKTKHTTLMGKVDSQLLNKIKEYRENIHEMSQEKLSTIASGESRDRLLMEASQFIEEAEPEARDMNQIIQRVDKKLTELIKKYSELQLKNLNSERERMLKGVEQEVEQIISQQIDLIKSEAGEHIDETVQYYKKKLESDNQLLSNANNIIARREQILDEAYEKSLKIVEESEEKAAKIIEQSAHAHDEAEAIIAEFERKGEEIRQEAEMEAERIIADANVESARIIQVAEDQHQDIVDAATQDGFSVGYQEGKEEAVKENSELLNEALNSLNKLHAAFPVAVKQNDDKLTRISYQIAESVLGERVDEKPDLCVKTLNTSIRHVSDLDNVKIKVNPVDLDTILPKQEYFKSILPDVQEFVVLGDHNVNKGGCKIHTKSDEIDISINTQLSILDAVFNDALSRENEQYQDTY